MRLRFAPSPTGHLHIGNARTALLNWIFARQNGGQFILRIEDTDVERSTQDSEQTILNDLRWLGLDWDEGPDVGGTFGPYRQSQRLEMYRKQLDVLIKTEKAYPCFCSEDKLGKKREAAKIRGEQVYYDRTCLKLSQDERDSLLRSGQQPVWRFVVRDGDVSWEDRVKGTLNFNCENFGDFVIMRKDGLPTYNFAVVVDDKLMNITHVIRGDDHVSNTPKQILIYEALGWELPKFGHIPMILGTDRTRLSKRHGATSVSEFRAQGYLPNALVNFLSLLSWSSESGDEILSVDRLISEFNFERMNVSPAIFDLSKFKWMNSVYIRDLDSDALLELALPYLDKTSIDVDNKEKLTKVLSLTKESVDSLAQFSSLAEPFYREDMQLKDGQAISWSSKDSSQKIYWAFLRYIQNYEAINSDIFREMMKLVQKETGIMGKDLWMPIRVALTGKLHGPDLPMVAEILGREKCERFVRSLIH
ncbi:MAG: glutamate--tRNA ligase [bacterium]